MSSSIRAPWIHDYLLQAAEQHGGSLVSVGLETKGRRAQLLQWLTYPRDDDEEVFIWAIISDKVHSVYVRFSKEAVKSFRQNPLFSGRKLTEYRTAMIIIKQFRPFCSRIPLGWDKGMSNSVHVCLEVNDFGLSGAFNEPMWGSPKAIELHSDISEWVQGLRQGGGAGNVLKQRKAAQLQNADANEQAKDVQDATEGASHNEAAPKAIPRKITLAARKTVIKPLVVTTVQRPDSVRVETKLDPKEAYEPSKKYMPVPEDVKEKLRTLSFNLTTTVSDSGRSESTGDNVSDAPTPSSRIRTPPRKRRRRDALDLESSEPDSPDFRHSELPEEPLPATPSHWSPSNRGSPRTDAASLAAIDEESEDDVASVRPNNSSPLPPSRDPFQVLPSSQDDNGSPVPRTAQTGVPASSNAVAAPEPTSSYLSAPTPAQRPRPVPSSSSPPFPSTAQEVSVSAVMETPLAAPFSSAPPIAASRPPHLRRVPRPIYNPLSPDPNVSGPGRILVPNSDTSASLSQDQPFSQPSQQDNSSQEKSQDQKEPQRSQQSLSYASESQGSKSDPKSQGSRQSQLRNEVTAAVEEAVREPVSPNVAIAEQSKKVVDRPQSTDDARPSNPPALVADDAPDPGIYPEKADEKRNLISAKPPPARIRSKPFIPSQQVVPDSESETEQENTGDEQDELESAAGSGGASRHSHPLDSDDERTKAMVDRYTVKHTTGSTVQKVRERTRQMSSTIVMPPVTPSRKQSSVAPRQISRTEGSAMSLAHSHSSHLPLPPSSPDVFMSEYSFHASQISLPTQAARRRKSLRTQSTPNGPTTPVRDTRRSGSPTVPATGVVDTGSSDRTRVDKPPLPTHDPAAWEMPAFKRKPTYAQSDNTTSKPVPTPRTKPSKRAISVSSGSEPDEPPPKRRKTSTAAARTAGWVEEVSQNSAPQLTIGKSTNSAPCPKGPDSAPPAPKLDRQPAAGPSTLTKHIDLRRSASIVSSIQPIRKKRSDSGRSASPDKSTSAKPDVRMVRQLSPGGSTPIEIKYVTFNSGSGRSSSASISKAKMKSRGSADTTPSVRDNRTRDVRADARPVSRLGDRSRPAEPGPPTKQATRVLARRSIPKGTMEAPKQTPVSTASTRIPPTSAGSSSSVVKTKAGPSREAAAPRPQRLLGGYEVDFDMSVEEGGPPLVTWSMFQEILRTTGRARHKLKQEARSKQGRG
ncbi:uncharacterized protein B0H18DRAFT_1114395 [Fomitopsis serialis]|uniref:uncharacterized protein n=1 Tax=Fomitopsis serialis TaxID=139415 RepID=UPI002008EAE6|nr:uncharacterized protein B0H18DRAFT_1114395 [Neoantrodia serialis]KAH9935678.1 hypothetical protein B0H18DRAFT_1114395 [Neoantrodia serialis]